MPDPVEITKARATKPTIIYWFGGSALLNDIAIRVTAGGVIGAVLAAVPGLIDYLSLTGGPRKIATIHMNLDLLLVVVFLINSWWRNHQTPVESGKRGFQEFHGSSMSADG